MSGIKLNHTGERIVTRGGDKQIERGDDLENDDSLLIMEIMKRAPGMELSDYQHTFIALREQYGEHALAAIREGYVQFELRSTRDMPEPEASDG